MILNMISEIMVKTTVLVVIVITAILIIVIDIYYGDSNSDYSHEDCCKLPKVAHEVV